MTTKQYLFEPGEFVATPGVMTLALNEAYLRQCLRRHLAGDFGNVDEEDREANRAAITEGTRILSAYPIDPAKPCRGHSENTLWIMTEADRSRTTFLLPEEY